MRESKLKSMLIVQHGYVRKLEQYSTRQLSPISFVNYSGALPCTSLIFKYRKINLVALIGVLIRLDKTGIKNACILHKASRFNLRPQKTCPYLWHLVSLFKISDNIQLSTSLLLKIEHKKNTTFVSLFGQMDKPASCAELERWMER